MLQQCVRWRKGQRRSRKSRTSRAQGRTPTSANTLDFLCIQVRILPGLIFACSAAAQLIGSPTLGDTNDSARPRRAVPMSAPPHATDVGVTVAPAAVPSPKQFWQNLRDALPPLPAVQVRVASTTAHPWVELRAFVMFAVQVEFEDVSFFAKVPLQAAGVANLGNTLTGLLNPNKVRSKTKAIVSHCSGVLEPGTITLVRAAVPCVQAQHYERWFVSFGLPSPPILRAAARPQWAWKVNAHEDNLRADPHGQLRRQRAYSHFSVLVVLSRHRAVTVVSSLFSRRCGMEASRQMKLM